MSVIVRILELWKDKKYGTIIGGLIGYASMIFAAYLVFYTCESTIRENEKSRARYEECVADTARKGGDSFGHC